MRSPGALEPRHAPVTYLERSVEFYERLRLTLIVVDPPRYARFECPAGDSTLSLAAAEGGAGRSPRTSVHFECEALDERVGELKTGIVPFEQDQVDQPYLWREAITRDPDGHPIFLYRAGRNRRWPPWRLEA